MDSQYILSDLGNVYDKRMREYRLPFSIFIFLFSAQLCVYLPNGRKKKDFFLISIYLKSGQEGLGGKGVLTGAGGKG